MSNPPQPQIETPGGLGTERNPIRMGGEPRREPRPYKPAPFIPPPRTLHAEMAAEFAHELPERPENAPKAYGWASPRSVQRNGDVVARAVDGEWEAVKGSEKFLSVVKRYFPVPEPDSASPAPEPRKPSPIPQLPHPSMVPSVPREKIIMPADMPVADALPVREDGLPPHDVKELGPNDLKSMQGHTHTVTIYKLTGDGRTATYRWAHRGEPTADDIRYYFNQSGI